MTTTPCLMATPRNCYLPSGIQIWTKNIRQDWRSMGWLFFVSFLIPVVETDSKVLNKVPQQRRSGRIGSFGSPRVTRPQLTLKPAPTAVSRVHRLRPFVSPGRLEVLCPLRQPSYPMDMARHFPPLLDLQKTLQRIQPPASYWIMTIETTQPAMLNLLRMAYFTLPTMKQLWPSLRLPSQRRSRALAPCLQAPPIRLQPQRSLFSIYSYLTNKLAVNLRRPRKQPKVPLQMGSWRLQSPSEFPLFSTDRDVILFLGLPSTVIKRSTFQVHLPFRVHLPSV